MTATAIPDLERVGSTRPQGGALAYLIEAWVLGVAAVRFCQRSRQQVSPVLS